MKIAQEGKTEGAPAPVKRRKNVWIDADVHLELSHRALDEERPVQEVAEELLRWALKRTAKRKTRTKKLKE